MNCEGVANIHDLHVWSIGSNSHALSAHIVIPPSVDPSDVSTRVETILQNRFPFKPHYTSNGNSTALPYTSSRLNIRNSVIRLFVNRKSHVRCNHPSVRWVSTDNQGGKLGMKKFFLLSVLMLLPLVSISGADVGKILFGPEAFERSEGSPNVFDEAFSTTENDGFCCI